MNKKTFITSTLILIISLTISVFSFAQTEMEPTPLKVGDQAPEISLTSPNGEIIKLSSLKGKIVLIDFWASWCKPCRYENPNIVAAYKKYNKAQFKDAKGFEIYSVSLDRSKEAWVQAIKQDQLDWDAHVSDLKYWYSIAATDYNVTSIPTNFLIDKDGKIIAIGLRGAALHKTLDNYVKSF